MAGVKLSETVKFAKISISTLTQMNSMTGEEFALNLGPQDIALLLSLRLIIPSSSTTSVKFIWGLYRKSLPAALLAADLYPPDFQEKDDICAIGGYEKIVVAESFKGLDMDDFLFPRPLVVIRNPTLWIRNMLGGIHPILGMLYYITQGASDVDLAKLMVKDHA